MGKNNEHWNAFILVAQSMWLAGILRLFEKINVLTDGDIEVMYNCGNYYET